jgi:hypothetical protein
MTITGTIKGPLTVRAGQAVELAPGAKVNGKVKVEAGGSLDVEEASILNALGAHGATLIRICGASIGGFLNVSGTTGPVVVGEGTPGCSGSTISKFASVHLNPGGVTFVGNAVLGGLGVIGNAGGTTVKDNTVSKALTVTGNSGTVVDRPNSVGGHSRIQ